MNDTRVGTLEELLGMYRPDRFQLRGEDYMRAIVKSHKDRLSEIGKTLISHHDSINGQTIYLYA